jgi:predicted nucleotidyltransferase
MPDHMPALLHDLPGDVARVLAEFVDAARGAFGDELVSVVLYGSAAEGALRA